MPTPLQPSTSRTSAEADDLIIAAARELPGETGYQQTLDRVAYLAARAAPECAAVTVSILTKHVPSTAASTDPGGQVADQMQFELCEGPTLDAMAHQASTFSSDVAHDTRWARWGARAGQQLGLTSVLSCALFTSASTLGALTLYGSSPATFTSHDVSRLNTFAAVAAAAIHAAHTEEHLQRANTSRLVIGQAQGILMKQFDLDAERAFAVMNRISQDTNTRLVAVAERVVTTRSLP